MQRDMKNGDFRPIYRFISEMIQDSAIVIWNVNKNSYVIHRMVLFPMTILKAVNISNNLD